MRRTRFAPSPTGPLHLGHAYSALCAASRADPGEFLVRIEDLDASRCRPEYEAAIFVDLRWLGLRWPEPVLRQSTRGPAYRVALDRLAAAGLVYPCRCTRGDIRAALAAPQEGGGEPPYPGTCRRRRMADAQPGEAIRLNLAAALAALPGPLPDFTETGPEFAGQHAVNPARLLGEIGDSVLARHDGAAAYHLAVVLDDAHQRVSEVVRGADLFAATFLHVLLQSLLGLPTPGFHHHALIRDAAGKRLAKRDDARALTTFRAGGASPADIRRMVGL